MKRAAQLYQLAADHGDETAKYFLANLYFSGRGVEENPVLAFALYRQAAEEGETGAQVQLGYCYERGIGTQADPQEAFKWYERAAQDGDEVGCNNLGYCYEQGLGVQADQEKAVRWYQAAVDRGMPLACKNLAAHYEEGSGVPKDLARAEELYSRAAQAGVKGAQERLDRLRGEPVQTTQAEQRKRFGWRGLAGVSVLFTMLFGAILTSPDIGHDWPTFLILTVVFALLGGFCMKKARQYAAAPASRAQRVLCTAFSVVLLVFAALCLLVFVDPGDVRDYSFLWLAAGSALCGARLLAIRNKG